MFGTTVGNKSLNYTLFLWHPLQNLNVSKKNLINLANTSVLDENKYLFFSVVSYWHNYFEMQNGFSSLLLLG